MRKGFASPLWLCAAIAALSLFAVLHWDGGDGRVMRGFYDDAAQGFVGQGRWWSDGLMHRGGRAFVIAVASLCLLAAIFRRGWRADAVYVLACMALVTGLVGALKHYSPLDCPRALLEYGGTRTHYRLFETHPGHREAGRCFPGGHSSGAFSLLAFHFVLRRRRAALSWAALAGALALGAAFSATQWARGSHFPSHDLASLVIAVAVCAALDCARQIRSGRKDSSPPFRRRCRSSGR